jgi:hypothetical protein
MKNSFLEYYKLILEKVSFDRDLFRKEYRKAVRLLQENEIRQLNMWIQECGLHNHLLKMKTGRSEIHLQAPKNTKVLHL